MSYIKASDAKTQEYFDYLEDLRQSGDTNMFGARPYLQAAFGLSEERAAAILKGWMDGHDDPSLISKGPLSKKKTSVRIETTTTVDREDR